MVVLKHGKSILKATKLLKVSVEFDDCIRSIQISGDFFMHPEEKITELEEKLVGTKARDEDVLRVVDVFMNAGGVEVFGFTAEDLTKAVLMACADEVK
ncbi:hypothetical protein HY992_03285 [Candidatus Micrarchaeota archaeon]|nr:hypothetical protein [Candidatus Micrarchaeota archaeon]